ncbi:DNA gyrase subunit A [Candidatus Lucifugimonas marina]|uniref:DNA gyrase subunit A n=1 Tax=Candidatus Lucifugimonas marina TaxID=3038979 RepID=A0AAJ5ZF57_9CHLR|nr:DNA gyrase subunit A [SAR202 cluster bacterium JH702]MDG0870294.1 DNA gyrase subunit A [SAR202 cluster bacterium JH639]WFG36147.1 DNA gyrase subunit A [SAR202 cluster bacterium JH545]WFG40093.1 DNA gyrase subunit A [SAR202 cluster bacterium JH1073]
MVNSDLGDIRPIGIEEEMKTSYLDYAMSVIVSRALPDVRDGLKPVQRRILYAMHDQGMRPTSSYKKSARLVGEVLGKYHPHGDQSVYDAQVRMAQPFSLRYPLVDGQGNYGSVDGDPPAAMRYTECRLSSVTEMMLGDIDRDTVDWGENFDQSLKEPTVLPARLPALLVNGASGIAVGMATNIPPHNVSEICDAIVHMISHPDASVDDLMQFVQGPDFPTGAHIWGQEGIRNAYVSGRGRVMVQADHTIEDIPRQERKRLVFNEIPFQVNKANLVAKIADLIKNRKIEGISEVRDESDRKGMRIVLELRRGAHVPVVLNNLYKQTNLRNSFSVNMIALVDGTPRVLTLKQSLRHYIEFREEVVRRRAEFDLKKAKARLHVLEGLRIAIDNLDEVIALIRASADVEEARSSLMNAFDLSEIQAQAILDMQLRRLAALEREKIENEYNELLALVAELEELLADSAKVLAVVRKETHELKRKYGDERRTEVHKEELGDWRREDTEPHEDVVITLSRNGYVKRVKLDTYKKQHRGGRGVRGQRMTKEDDVTPHLQIADTHDYLLFFTDRGRVFASRVFELPADQSRNSRGTPVQNLGFNMEPREEVQAVVAVSSYLEDTYLVMATKQGQVKRMHLPLLRNMNRSGLRCFNLKGDDGLIGAVLADDDQDVILVSKEGMSIRFKSSEVRARQRAAGGMKGMTVQAKDEIVSMNVVDDEGYLLIVSQKGYGKLSLLRHYTQQRRGGKGLITLKVTTKTGRVADSAVVSEDIRTDSTGKLVLVSEKAQVIRTNLGEIRSTGRIAQGVKIQVPDAGDKISAIRVIDERREAGAEIDPAALENGNGSGDENAEAQADGEATAAVADGADEESTEESED